MLLFRPAALWSLLSPVAPIPLPAVRDLTRDSKLRTYDEWMNLLTYDESVVKLSNVSFRGKCARMGHPLKLPSPTKLARLGHFPLASQAGCLAGPVFYTISFLWLSFSPSLFFTTNSPPFPMYSVWRGEGGSQSDKELPQSPFPGHFSMTSFCIAFCESYLSMASSLHHKLT
jgi:hypothetical protein